MELTNARSAAAGCLSQEAVGEIVARYGNEILCVARRFSRCASDAEDAYQSALEALLTKAPEGDAERLAAWLMVVVRNEALMIGRRHKHIDRTAFEEIADGWAADEPLLDERVLDAESLGRRREALRRLTPDQMRCLLLKADGMTYVEISRATGISYASVNRYLTDGRRAFRHVLGRIDGGDECRRLEPVLSSIADGEADELARQDAKLHLTHCAACRATLADFRATPRGMAALFPVALAAPATGGGGLRNAVEYAQGLLTSLQERLAGPAANLQSGSEVAFAKKAVAVTAVTAALAAGGAGVSQVVTQPAEVPEQSEFSAELMPPAPATTDALGAPESDGTVENERPAVPVTPSAAEILSTTDSDASADSANRGDAAPGEDPFTDRPQFEPAPDSVADGDGQGGDSYGGLAP